MSRAFANLLTTLWIVLSLAPVLSADPTGTHDWIDETTFAERLTSIERATADLGTADVHRLVRRFALDLVHTEVRVRSARVIATYKREGWKTRPYFAVNYTKDTYVYLDELDPDFQNDLKHNLYWVSVVKTLPDRQLMFELAIDEATFNALSSDEVISFSCEIAAVIRGGKSVYSRLISLDDVRTPTK